MKVLFMGTPDFAATALKEVIKHHEVVAVISQPDKPKGRGKKLQPTPVKIVAQDNNIPVYQPYKIKEDEFVDFLESFEAEIFVVVAYGQILSDRILNMPKYGCINVHGSLLPSYRGAAPIQWSIINGDDITGVTIIYLKSGKVDSGPMILKHEMQIEPNETSGELFERMAPIGAKALIEAMELIKNGDVKAEIQDEDKATYTTMIRKEMSQIDWNRPSKDIKNMIRGLNPAPSASTMLNDEVLKIHEVDIIDCDTKAVAGEIIEVDNKRGIVVKTGDGSIIIKTLQARGGKKMSASDYLRGHSIEVGTILGVLL